MISLAIYEFLKLHRVFLCFLFVGGLVVWRRDAEDGRKKAQEEHSGQKEFYV